MARVVIVEKNQAYRASLTRWLHEAGHDPLPADDGPVGIELADAQLARAIVVDLTLPTCSGIEVGMACRRRNPTIGILVITRHDTQPFSAEIAKLEARVLKVPFGQRAFSEAVERTLGAQSGSSVGSLIVQDSPDFEDMIGSSEAMRHLYSQIVLAAGSSEPILIYGETGTGKELVARALHHLSRSTGPFVDVNCAALPDSLIESELFGHEAGAFTDARAPRAGLVETANFGTLFLDEVGDLSAAAQPKLLRVVERREVHRLGAATLRKIDVRIVAATNRDLRAEVGRGRFRADLYWRLSANRLVVPPLRERAHDVERLIRHFWTIAVANGRHRNARLTEDAMGRLIAHSWPGNVRELKHVLASVALASSGDVPAADFDHELIARAEEPAGSGTDAPHHTDGTLRARRHALDTAAIREALTRCGGNRTQAAAALGIDRSTLLRRLARLSDLKV